MWLDRNKSFFFSHPRLQFLPWLGWGIWGADPDGFAQGEEHPKGGRKINPFCTSFFGLFLEKGKLKNKGGYNGIDWKNSWMVAAEI